MFVLAILGKFKEKRLTFPQGSVTVLQIMGNYQDTRVKLTNTQLNKLKSAANHKTGRILEINKKDFQDEEIVSI